MNRKAIYGLLGIAVLGWTLVSQLRSDPKNHGTPDIPEAQPHAGLAKGLIARNGFDWRTREFAHGHIHYLPGSHAERSIDGLTTMVDSARSHVLGALGLMTDQEPIDVFFVDSREQMQQLVGHPIGGMVQSGERSALLVYNAEYAPFLVHELTHLYSHYNWGPPRHGRWISEGLAMWASGDCQGQTLSSLGRGLLETGRLRTWNAMMRDFDGMAEVSANIQAATMVEFVKSEKGIPAVRRLWTSQGWRLLEDELNRPFSDSELLYRERLRRVPDTGRLDVERLRRYGCQ